MELKTLYREILNEHNLNPSHKKPMENPSLSLRGVNPSCGDDITLNLKIQDGSVIDGSYTGSGCAVSQASVDMMLDLVIGKSKEEALQLADIFIRMIQGKASEAEIEELDEASSLQDISHMPARVKCAVLGWHTMEEMLAENKEGSISAEAGNPHCCN
ncbi:MAG: SUF system NifU family Fe-S cluster assembly protein [Treponema sp.]|jgi:nitrogen fixation NifU-like protein|nr:SUF system NifU family Fe-S cluster assembly protein [Treponema sp.]